MRAAAVVVALALGAEAFAPAPTVRTATALNAAGHAVIVRCSADGFDSLWRTPSTLYAARRLNAVEPRPL